MRHLFTERMIQIACLKQIPASQWMLSVLYLQLFNIVYSSQFISSMLFGSIKSNLIWLQGKIFCFIHNTRIMCHLSRIFGLSNSLKGATDTSLQFFIGIL